jgi:hypothetical protein
MLPHQFGVEQMFVCFDLCRGLNLIRSYIGYVLTSLFQIFYVVLYRLLISVTDILY